MVSGLKLRECKLWTNDEIAYLIDASDKVTRVEAAHHLKRSLGSVKNKCRELNIRFKKQYGGGQYAGQIIEIWSKAEELRLWELSERFTIAQVAEKMDRSYQAIYRKAQRMGISFKQGRLTFKDLAEILGIPRTAVPVVRDRLGLKFLQRDNPVNPTDKEIAFMAWHLLHFPKGRVVVPKSHLRSVIESYYPKYLTDEPDFPYTRRGEKVKRKEELSFCVYVIRNNKGQWLRTTVTPDKRTQWLNDIEQAKFYVEPASAKATVTKFKKKQPELGPFDVVRIKTEVVEVIV